MMKRALAVCAALIMVTFVGLAETTVDVEWDAYFGGVDIEFVAGDDATSTLTTGGNHAWGTFRGVDQNNNPYGYNVDTVRSQVQAYVAGGGIIQFQMDRTDSHVPMYGASGQYTVTNVWTYDGNASFATNTVSNFANMRTANYSFQNNNQYTASGSDFSIYHFIHAAAGMNAHVSVVGEGSAILTLMSDEMRASGWRLGEGAGSYTNAKFEAAGAGQFVVSGTAPNNVQTGWGWSVPGGTITTVVDYANGFNVNGINMSGN